MAMSMQDSSCDGKCQEFLVPDAHAHTHSHLSEEPLPESPHIRDDVVYLKAEGILLA